MLVPALIYTAVNWGDAVALRGWAIPAATDIAFAVGVLALLGPRIPASLKIFLLALAIIDDLGAIVIIAVWYSGDLSTVSLLLAWVLLIALATLNMLRVTWISLYVILGVLLWLSVLKSGVHATLAGVALALMIPLRAETRRGESPLRHLEHVLHPWVAFLIMPLFAFANSGVSLRGLSINDLLSPVPLGIAAGLFVGKQVGVFSFSWLACRLGIAEMPTGASLRQFYGVCLLTGVGFTMSLFIGTLAFDAPELTNFVRLGVLTGSVASALAGYLVLVWGAAYRESTNAGAAYQRQHEAPLS
jgi:NhaA family Na+:H+ antiporter